MSEYGDKYDKPIVIIMSCVIVASIAAVTWLNAAVHKTQCVPSYTTYCGDDAGHGHDSGHGDDTGHGDDAGHGHDHG